jgi:hypothetical protein
MKQLFDLPEYDDAFSRFVHRAIHELIHRLFDPLWINRPYYFKQNAYEYEQEGESCCSEPVHLTTEGGIVRKVNASLIDEVLVSPHIHLEEAIAIRDVILEICPLVQAKISSLLYSGKPETRELM